MKTMSFSNEIPLLPGYDPLPIRTIKTAESKISDIFVIYFYVIHQK